MNTPLKTCLPIASAGLLALATPKPAAAVLNYYIYESAPNAVTIKALGSIQLGGPPLDASSTCARKDALALGALESISGLNVLCTGPSLNINNLARYAITGPASFGLGNVTTQYAVSGSGTSTAVADVAPFKFAYLPATYASGDPIDSTSNFVGTFSSLGISGSGTVATFNVTGSDDKINLILAAPVPGPLPLFGAAAAFGWSRRLRRRCNSLGTGRPRP